jgi:hypothetical protein
MKKSCWFLVLAALVSWTAEGRAGGETYPTDRYGFISHWLCLLEPLPMPALGYCEKAEISRESAADKEFFPGMKTCTPKEGDKVKLDEKDQKNLADFWNTNPSDNKSSPGEERTWRANHEDRYRNYVPPRHNALYLLVTYIVCTEEMPGVRLKAGIGDFGTYLLNGKEIIRALKNAKMTTIDEYTSEPVTLKKGVNVLMAQVLNSYGGHDIGVCARFVDKDDKPVTNIRISLTPPAK